MGKARRGRVHVDPVVGACFVVLLGFPLAAAIVAGGQPVDPEASASAPRSGKAGRPLQVLPAFSPGSALGQRVEADGLPDDERRMRATLTAAMRDLAGARRARAIMRLAGDASAITSEQRFGGAGYPYRYPQLEPLLDAALRGAPRERRQDLANDVAALLVLAAASDHRDAFSGAPAVAFALLHRARAGRACVPQRNLAFLVSTDPHADEEIVRDELRLAARLCPQDPTPAWMQGQYESRHGVETEGRPRQAAIATFRRLQREIPGSPLGWSGEADALLRLGYEHEEVLQPFTARTHFRRALKLYRRAQQLDDDPGLAAGTARALAGLHEYDGAAREQRRALAGRDTLAPLAVRYVEYLERGHRFAAAAQAARRLTVAHEFASGRSLIGGRPYGTDEDLAEDVETPMSIGVDSMWPVALDVGRAGGGVLPAVTDLSFIPRFREMPGLTGHDRWCPSWSLPRDLLLSGRPGAALDALPARTVDLPTGLECDVDLAGVEAMAALEAGREQRALERLQDAGVDGLLIEPIEPLPTARGRELSDMYEAQQNMWRFAGELGRADRAARAWLERLPHDPRAADRLGEIAFLAGRFEEAARLFARSVRLTRSRVTGWTAQEATGLLKRGTALVRAERLGAAVAVLERADEVATRADAQERGVPAVEFASYHARVQLGDALLRTGRYADAAEAYAAAHEREPSIADFNNEILARPEALHNNQAIAETKLGHRAEAIEAAGRALEADPQSPVFLETKGHAMRVAGRLSEAERAYRAAVRSEPTAIAAWNDLGVVLARQGRLGDAAQAFRRAVGVRSDYALGWFNLGIAQARRGLRHALSSQGAFGRAFRADAGLADRRRELIADDAVFFTNLDLSKPLPPRWSYARAQEGAPVAAAGFALIVLLGLRLGRRLLATRFGGDLAGRLIEPLTELARRYPRVPIYTPWLVAVAATIATFAVGLLKPGAGGTIDAVVLVVGVLALIVLVLRGRSLGARNAGVKVGRRGWTPGIALAAAATAFGTAWAPLPVAEPERPAAAVHLIGPVLTGLAALGLLILGAWLAIPGTLALAAAALVITASLLTPAKPLDGGFVATGNAGVAATLALLAGGLFFALGVA